MIAFGPSSSDHNLRHCAEASGYTKEEAIYIGDMLPRMVNFIPNRLLFLRHPSIDQMVLSRDAVEKLGLLPSSFELHLNEEQGEIDGVRGRHERHTYCESACMRHVFLCHFALLLSVLGKRR